MPSQKFDPEDKIIIVEAKLHGSVVTTARMVLDTGASLMMIPWKFATALKLKIDLDNTIQTTTASTVETSPLTIIPQVSVLGLKAKKVEALVKDLPPESGVDGLLGLSFLKNFKLSLDFKKGRFILE